MLNHMSCESCMSKCEPVLAFCSFPLCRNKAASECVCAYLGRSLAMCLLKPSSLRHNASSPIKLVFAMRLRLSNVSSQRVCVTQCVLAMRLRHPMRLQNAPAPAHASCLFLTNASSQCRCVFRSFCHTSRGPRNVCIIIHLPILQAIAYIYVCVYTHTCRVRHLHRDSKTLLTGCSCSLQPKFDGDHGAELFGRPQLHLRGHRVQDLRLRQGVNI